MYVCLLVHLCKLYQVSLFKWLIGRSWPYIREYEDFDSSLVFIKSNSHDYVSQYHFRCSYLHVHIHPYSDSCSHEYIHIHIPRQCPEQLAPNEGHPNIKLMYSRTMIDTLARTDIHIPPPRLVHTRLEELRIARITMHLQKLAEGYNKENKLLVAALVAESGRQVTK